MGNKGDIMKTKELSTCFCTDNVDACRDFYQNYFRNEGIEIITPSENEQELINNLIFDELVLGIIKKRSKDKLLNIIDNYDIDGVILGCTELPLILEQKDIDKHVLNTLEIHAEEGLKYSLKD